MSDWAEEIFNTQDWVDLAHAFRDALEGEGAQLAPEAADGGLSEEEEALIESARASMNQMPKADLASLQLRWSIDTFQKYADAIEHIDDHECPWGLSVVLDLMDRMLAEAGRVFFGGDDGDE